MIANELRIDNWYLLVNPMSSEPPKPYRFETWTSATDFIAYGQPIPLTPEILEKAGFAKKYDYYEIWYGNEDISFQLLNDGWYRMWECDGMEGRTGIAYKYVHQLQNLYFALTGEELKLDL